MESSLPKLYSLPEVATLLSKSTRTVRRMILAGELEAIDRGRMVTERQLAAYFDTQEREACLRAKARRDSVGSSSSRGEHPASITSAGTKEAKPEALALALAISRPRKSA